MRQLLNILFWSVIAAAFIGPGTVTTAAASGTRFGFTLLWALVFSTVACLVLQEASARVAVVSGRPLARAIRDRFHGGIVGAVILFAVVGAIVVGCAAYEAGNILGSVAGASLGTDVSPRMLTVMIGLVSAALLFFANTTFVARVLGALVAMMGTVFLVTAVMIGPELAEVLRGALVPSSPKGANLLVLGLIGTTVVPYNLFLGSGIAQGQRLRDVRIGLAVAVVLGGVISMAILVVGTTVVGEFSFGALADTLSERLGSWARLFFAIGLFAAGLSSAITAPLAAAITTRGLFDNDTGRWHERSARYRGVWVVVLGVGVFFGLIDVKPIPVIIFAQVLNGLVLPFVAMFLLFIVNDRSLMGKHINGAATNGLTGIVVAVMVALGLTRTVKALATAAGVAAPREGTLLVISCAAVLIAAIPVLRRIRRLRLRIGGK